MQGNVLGISSTMPKATATRLSKCSCSLQTDIADPASKYVVTSCINNTPGRETCLMGWWASYAGPPVIWYSLFKQIPKDSPYYQQTIPVVWNLHYPLLNRHGKQNESSVVQCLRWINYASALQYAVETARREHPVGERGTLYNAVTLLRI